MLIEEDKSQTDGVKFDKLKKTQSMEKLLSNEDPFTKGQNKGN